MSDKYTTEVKRFIYRSLEHLECKGKSGMSLDINGIENNTGKKFRAHIRIEIEDEEKEEEEQH